VKAKKELLPELGNTTGLTKEWNQNLAPGSICVSQLKKLCNHAGS